MMNSDSGGPCSRVSGYRQRRYRSQDPIGLRSTAVIVAGPGGRRYRLGAAAATACAARGFVEGAAKGDGGPAAAADAGHAADAAGGGGIATAGNLTGLTVNAGAADGLAGAAGPALATGIITGVHKGASALAAARSGTAGHSGAAAAATAGAGGSDGVGDVDEAAVTTLAGGEEIIAGDGAVGA